MTYCLALRLTEGLVFLSDTRTNAGVDNISTFRKLHVLQPAHDRVFVLQPAGSLATTHELLDRIDRDLRQGGDERSLATVETLGEAALYIGDTAKVLTLVILGLVQRGALTLLNKSPLQLEVTNPNLPLEDYEQVLVDGIADDGTIPQATINRLMRIISTRLQQKIWNADAEETRRAYRRRADDLWEEWQHLPPVHRVERETRYYPWILLSNHYRPEPVSETAGDLSGSVGPRWG